MNGTRRTRAVTAEITSAAGLSYVRDDQRSRFGEHVLPYEAVDDALFDVREGRMGFLLHTPDHLCEYGVRLKYEAIPAG